MTRTTQPLRAISFTLQALALCGTTVCLLMGLLDDQIFFTLLLINFCLGVWQMSDALLGIFRRSTWRTYYFASAATYLMLLAALACVGGDLYQVTSPLDKIYLYAGVIGLPTAMSYAYAWLCYKDLSGEKVI